MTKFHCSKPQIKALSAEARGTKGEKGDKGDKGERGESISVSEIDSIVEDIVDRKMKALPVPSTSSSSLERAKNNFDTSRCVRVEEIRGAETFELQRGMEVCQGDGKLLGTITKTFSSYFYVQPPDNSAITCSNGGFTCRLPWDRSNRYYIERITEGDNGPVFLMRRKG